MIPRGNAERNLIAMNSLFIWSGAAIALAAALAVERIGSALARQKNKNAETGKFPVFAAICAFALLACVSGSALTAAYYRSHGAFYDSSWRKPSVESHFLFDTSDTDALRDIYASDPENFNTRLYDVIVIRLGCEDCESQAGRIRAAKEEIGERKGRPAYIIFSRSEIGRLYVSEYNITDVPVAIIGGVKIPLYDIAD